MLPGRQFTPEAASPDSPLTGLVIHIAGYLGKQAANAVIDLSDLGGEIIVEAAKHGELGEPLVGQSKGAAYEASSGLAASWVSVLPSSACRTAMRCVASRG